MLLDGGRSNRGLHRAGMVSFKALETELKHSLRLEVLDLLSYHRGRNSVSLEPEHGLAHVGSRTALMLCTMLRGFGGWRNVEK